MKFTAIGKTATTAVALLLLSAAAIPSVRAAEESKPAETAAAAPAAAPAVTIKDPNANPVVATVDGKDILRGDVLEFIKQQPEQIRQMPTMNIFPLAQEQLVLNSIVSAKADKAGIADDKEVTALIAQAKEQIIRNVFLERQVKAQMTDKKLRDAYKKVTDSLKNVEEVKARHILVDSEDKAKEIIAQLDKKTPFEQLAKDNSKDPNAAQGGELGYFAKNEMVPEFADAAFALKKGQHTETPVKTQFGWHIIEVEDRRKRAAPKFEDVKPQLEAQVRQDIVTSMVKDWQKDAKIQTFDINGEPVKETKSN